MTTRVKIEIRSNEGYNAKQVTERHHTMTVGDLRRQLEDYDDDAEIVTYDLNNERGADGQSGQTIDEIAEATIEK